MRPLDPSDGVVPLLRLTLAAPGTPRTGADMVFGVRHLVWYLSQFLVLEPGDVIDTGTPAGVALGRPGTPYLRPGDVVEVEVAGLGAQRQVCRPAEPGPPSRRGTGTE